MLDLKVSKKSRLKQSKESKIVWWKHGVIYHIYPRSFYDSNGDGIGDLQGIISKLDYLYELGVNAIWLSPIYQSTHVDFGYDVSHYRKIDSVFGSMQDFKTLLEEAHERNIKVIMDLVLNHTSIDHDWFSESRSSVDNPKRDWYIWKKREGNKLPNNWKSAFGGSGWTYDKTTDSYYFHSFLPEQPDLNWRNSQLKETLFEDIKFWLDLGVDGFRLDVINMIAKDKKYRDNPNLYHSIINNKRKRSRNRNHSIKITENLRELINTYDEEKVVVGEVYAPPPGDSKLAAKYLGTGQDNLNLTFDFSLIFTRWGAKNYYHSISKWYKQIPEDAWPSNVLSNHDLLRSINRVRWRTKKLEKAKIEALLLLTLKGTPFIYYGEEIAQANHWLKKKDLKDPLGKKLWPFFPGRDPARTPMQWSKGEYTGFSYVEPWLPANKKNAKREGANVLDQTGEQYSMLNLYKRLIHIRNTYKALMMGSWIPLNQGQNGILMYLRKHQTKELLVMINFTSQVKTVPLPDGGERHIIFSINKPLQSLNKYKEFINLEPYAGVILKCSD